MEISIKTVKSDKQKCIFISPSEVRERRETSWQSLYRFLFIDRRIQFNPSRLSNEKETYLIGKSKKNKNGNSELYESVLTICRHVVAVDVPVLLPVAVPPLSLSPTLLEAVGN